jgi:hypothetical protein
MWLREAFGKYKGKGHGVPDSAVGDMRHLCLQSKE